MDGVEMEELYDYIKENWKSIKEQIEQRKYKPQPVRRVEIPKPNGGIRKLGLPMIIWKQWKLPSKRQWGLQKLGVGKDLARLTAYCGDRYYWVVTKTCVVRAISKEKLAQAGLVSLLDNYTERHALKFS